MLKHWLAVILLVCCIAQTNAQTCPENIDYSQGNFNKWICSIGFVDPNGVVSVTPGPPVYNRQTLNPNTSTAVDPYGKFSVVAPNGNANTLMLGNSSGGHQAEQVSYVYSIPPDKQDFIFTYYYAVVLQLINHLPYERPRFAVKLTDLTTNKIIDCGTHNFISGDGLGAFKRSTVANDVEYRDWSTVAVNLSGLGGHTVRFDFTTNDCVYQAHFGYAYLSFNDPCDNSTQTITGNYVCSGLSAVTLTAPPGFDQYTWHLEGSNVFLSGDRQYVPPTLPPDGTQYVVEAESFTGVGSGCPATFKTTIHIVNQPFVLKVKSSVTACLSQGVNLKDASITAGSSSDIKFKYFIDPNQKEAIRDPTSIFKDGVYYILGTNSYGCSDLKAISVNLVPNPDLTAIPPKAVCKPQTVDITNPDILGQGAAGSSLEYYYDILLTKPVLNPQAVTDIGSYYIKVTNNYGCSTTVPVKVTIYETPYIKAATYTGCAPFNLNLPIYHTDDTNNLTYSYFADAAGTIPIDHPEAITAEGVYYARGTNEIGCTTPSLVPLTVVLNPAALFIVLNPTPVKYPGTVDISTTFTPYPGYTYSYYADQATTIKLGNFNAVGQSGVYYIKAVSAYGCELVKSVTVTITEPDLGGILVNNTFTPNGDGTNDEFVPQLQGLTSINFLKIYSRNGALVFETKDLSQHWRGIINGTQLPPGTYYWVFSGTDDYRKKPVTQSGAVTLIR